MKMRPTQVIRVVLPLALVVCLAAVVSAAPAATPPTPAPAPPSPPSTPPTPPSPPPATVVKPAVLRVVVASPLHSGRKVVGMPGERVRIRGTLSPYVAGQSVIIRVLGHGRRARQRTLPIVRARAGKSGRFGLWFRPRRRGKYTIRAASVGSAQLQPLNSRRKHLIVIKGQARSGSRGLAVRVLQRRLSALGYLTPRDGLFGGATGRAVLTFRKVNGLNRNSSADGAVFRKLARGGGGFHVRYPKAGRHVEFDWSRQVLVLAQGARPKKTLHASSGKPSTPTVFGHFHFYSKTPGYNSRAMFYSNYFIGGYAIHGFADVPTFAASHGCIRIPVPSAISVYRWIKLGDDIFVYR